LSLAAVAQADATVSPTTNPATAITLSDATLNGTNGTADATDSSFWASTSTFSTATPSLPAGVFSTADFGPIASSTNYSAQLSSITGLLPVTPNTTYYYAAWTEVAGTWSPGAVVSFTTLPTVSADASLSNLAISSGTLTPAFSASTTLYTDSVSNGVSSVTITPTANNASSTITVDGMPVASGTSSSPITLVVGANPPILTVVTAQDGVTTDSYSITVTRASVATSTNTYVVTDPATNVTGSDATLNGMNGTADADGHSFWASTSTFSTASPIIPPGAYSTADLGPIASSTAFSAQLSSVNGLPAITPNTTYYFAAWSHVNGTWYPGAVESFTTSTSTSTTGTIGGTSTGGQSTGTLAVTGVTAVKTTGIADGTFADGWQYVFDITVPTDQTNLAMKFADWLSTSGSSTIPVANNMEISSAQADNNGAEVLITGSNVYSSPTLHMTTDLDPTTAGDQVQITVQVALPSSTVNGSYTTSYGVRSQ